MMNLKSSTARRFSGAQKLWIGIAAVSLLLIAAGIAFWWLKTEFFENNPHFTLKKILISRPDGVSRTYWNAEQHREQRIRDLQDELPLEIGVSNLFALDLAQLKTQFLSRHAEVSRVVIRRILPDQLLFEIYERLPVANIGPGVPTNVSRAEPVDRYVDEEGYVFLSSHCEQVLLPRIVDMSDIETGRLELGAKITTGGVKQALAFIKLVNRAYPEIRIQKITLVANQYFTQVTLRYRNHDYIVNLPYPVSEEKLQNDVMGRLIPTLRLQHQKQDFQSIIDLRYENQAVAIPR